MNILGTSKVAAQNKITLIAEVTEILNTRIGDRIAFLKSGDNIIIKKLADIEWKEMENLS